MNNILINNIPYEIPDIKTISTGLAVDLKCACDTLADNDERSCQQLLKKILPESCGYISNASEFIRTYAAYITNEISGLLRKDPRNAADAFSTDGIEDITLPQVREGYDGNKIYLPEITAGDFCDATDLLAADPVKYSPMIVSLISGNGR